MLDTNKGEVNPIGAGRLGAEDDELRIYIVILKDVGRKMSKGKFGIQCAHAALTTWALCVKRDPEHAWIYMRVAQAKIALQIDTEDELRALHQHARTEGFDAALITDAGRTEFGHPTLTALAIGPIWYKAESGFLKGLKPYRENEPGLG